MSNRHHDRSNERNTNKCVCLVHSIQKSHSRMADIMSDNHLATITLVNFFRENICWVNNGNTRLPTLCAGGAPDEKLKINKLGFKHISDMQREPH